MALTRGERAVAGVPSVASAPTAWETLGRRQAAELVVPGALIGLLGGTIAGALAVSGGLNPWLALVSAITLGVPLAVVGGIYEILLAKGRVPLGPLAPAAMVWIVGFPIARVLHALLVNVYASSEAAVPNGWAGFIVYNTLLSVPFAIGFWWLHENFAPRWWMHLEGRNPVAAEFLAVLVSGVRERRQRKAPDGRLRGLAGMQERRLRRRKKL